MGWRHIADKDVKARTDHRCWLCGQKIASGETYRRRTGYDDNGPVAIHMHPECEADTHDWDQTEWELFNQYEFDRPPIEN